MSRNFCLPNYIYCFVPKKATQCIFYWSNWNKEGKRKTCLAIYSLAGYICSLPGFVALPVSGCIFNSAVACIPRRGLCYKNIPACFGLCLIHSANLQLIRVQFPLLVDPLGCTSVWIRILNAFWLHHCPPRFQEIKTEKHSVSLRVSHSTKVSFFSPSTHQALSDHCWQDSCPVWHRGWVPLWRTNKDINWK